MLGNVLGWSKGVLELSLHLPNIIMGLGLALPFSLESCLVYVAQSFNG
jgi:hypothetical protein